MTFFNAIKKRYQKYLLKKELEQLSQNELNTRLINLFRQQVILNDPQSLEMAHYLLSSPELSHHADIHAEDDYIIKLESSVGNLDVIQYLLTSPLLKEHANHRASHDESFIVACRNGHIEVVEYLLTSPELDDHADIHAKNDAGFEMACQQGQIKVVNCLIRSPELEEHVDLRACGKKGYILAISEGRINMVEYLLSFDREQRIDFQQTDYNIEWAMKNKQDTILRAMMLSLKRNNVIDYLEHLPLIEQYYLSRNKEDIYQEIFNYQGPTYTTGQEEVTLVF